MIYSSFFMSSLNSCPAWLVHVGFQSMGSRTFRTSGSYTRVFTSWKISASDCRHLDAQFFTEHINDRKTTLEQQIYFISCPISVLGESHTSPLEMEEHGPFGDTRGKLGLRVSGLGRKKLTARPVVYQTPGANRRRAANLARSTGMVGVVRDIVVPWPCRWLRWRKGKKMKMTM